MPVYRSKGVDLPLSSGAPGTAKHDGSPAISGSLVRVRVNFVAQCFWWLDKLSLQEFLHARLAQYVSPLSDPIRVIFEIDGNTILTTDLLNVDGDSAFIDASALGEGRYGGPF